MRVPLGPEVTTWFPDETMLMGDERWAYAVYYSPGSEVRNYFFPVRVREEKTASLRPRKELEGRVTLHIWGNGRGLGIDITASRFHGASIAGLVVGAMGCFIFGLYLRTWLRERKALASQPGQDMIA
ncbi:MAG: hypothetical protein ACYS9X_02265 [Planctomycetota bacterium]